MNIAVACTIEWWSAQILFAVSRIDESDVKRDIIAQYPEVGLTKRAVVLLCADLTVATRAAECDRRSTSNCLQYT